MDTHYTAEELAQRQAETEAYEAQRAMRMREIIAYQLDARRAAKAAA